MWFGIRSFVSADRCPLPDLPILYPVEITVASHNTLNVIDLAVWGLPTLRSYCVLAIPAPWTPIVPHRFYTCFHIIWSLPTKYLEVILN